MSSSTSITTAWADDDDDPTVIEEDEDVPDAWADDDDTYGLLDKLNVSEGSSGKVTFSNRAGDLDPSYLGIRYSASDGETLFRLIFVSSFSPVFSIGRPSYISKSGKVNQPCAASFCAFFNTSTFQNFVLFFEYFLS